MCANSCDITCDFSLVASGSRLNGNPQNTIERHSVAWIFIFYQVQKFWSRQKLQRIECGHLGSISKCFDHHYIGESMEMFNLVLQFPLIPQWDTEHDISKSMPGSNLQLVVTFDSSIFFDSVKNKSSENWCRIFTKIKNLGKRDARFFIREMYFR